MVALCPDHELPLPNLVKEGLPTNQKLSYRDPHRKAGQAAVALMHYTQGFWVPNWLDPSSVCRVQM